MNILLFLKCKLKELFSSRSKFYAEFETDRFVREQIFPDFSYKGIIVEVGGATPNYLSMSKHFKDTGWRCIVVEPNPEFVKLQRAAGNFVVECACSNENIESSPFQVVNWTNIPVSQAKQISEHSFSSLHVKKEYLDKHGLKSINDLSHRTIQVKVRTLNSILEELNLSRIDILSIDTEGWELEVMQGLNIKKYSPEIVILENYLCSRDYDTYMQANEYKILTKCGHNTIYRQINKF